MKHALDASSLAAFSAMVGQRPLFAFDFDGTLAPIVEHRDDAVMRPSTRALFESFSQRVAVAVISGRDKDDVGKRLGEARLCGLIGNHGATTGTIREDDARAQVAAMKLRLEPVLSGDGLDIEDKGLSLSVHWRLAPDRRAAAKRVLEAVDLVRGEMRIIPGKEVVNLVPNGAGHKGTALLRLAAETQAKHAVFLGDDETDEDAFRVDAPWLVGIRIGAVPRSSAAMFLRSQDEIDELLSRLLELFKEDKPWVASSR